MTFLLRNCFLFSLVLFFPLTSFSWNALGHKVVATIAYDHLKPSVRNRVDAMVADLGKEYPEITSFADIAPWPDAIRSQKIETYTHWHYTDVAFSDDGTPLKNVQDTDNAVWALDKIRVIMGNAHANRYEHARFLAFFTHIVGDLHQPLHSVSRISATHPDGDQGGNLFIVRYNGSEAKLHHVWDGGVGVFDRDASDDNVQELAAKITALYPESYFDKNVLSDLKPEDWAEDGMKHAKQYVYDTSEHQPLSSTYIDAGQRFAEQQAALAGYRLAEWLNELL